LRLVGGRCALEPGDVFVGRPRQERAIADALDVRGRQERLAHVGGVAGGMALQVGLQWLASGDILARLLGKGAARHRKRGGDRQQWNRKQAHGGIPVVAVASLPAGEPAQM